MWLIHTTINVKLKVTNSKTGKQKNVPPKSQSNDSMIVNIYFPDMGCKHSTAQFTFKKIDKNDFKRQQNN